MITPQKQSLNERDLERFLNDGYTDNVLEKSKLSKENVSDMLHEMADKADWNIDNMLSETIQTIEDRRLRNWFRSFLIAEKYGILPRLKGQGYPLKYTIMFASDDCVLVHSPRLVKDGPTSTIVLTPQGKIKVPEGKVLLNINSLLGGIGFTAMWNGKIGIYTENGDVLFPCIFDDMENKYYLNGGDFVYKGFKGRYMRIDEEFAEEYMEEFMDDNDKIFIHCHGWYYRLSVGGKDAAIRKGAITYYSADDDDDSIPQLSHEEVMEMRKVIINELRTIMASVSTVLSKKNDDNE